MFKFGIFKITDEIIKQMVKNDVGQNSYECLNCKRHIPKGEIIKHIKSLKHIKNSVIDEL